MLNLFDEAIIHLGLKKWDMILFTTCFVFSLLLSIDVLAALRFSRRRTDLYINLIIEIHFIYECI
jgi:hypothetical protein